jgi:hypothetical protein
MGNAENKFLDCLKWKTILKHSIFEPFISGFIIFQKPIEIIIREHVSVDPVEEQIKKCILLANRTVTLSCLILSSLDNDVSRKTQTYPEATIYCLVS